MQLNRNICLFVVAVAFLGIAGGIYETTYNNYLEATFSVTSHSHDLVDLRLIDTIVNEYGVVPKDVVGPDGYRILDPHPLID